MFKHILIPTDGTPVANKAAKAGIALAHRLGAKVTVYFVVEDLQPIYVEGYAFNQKELDSFDERARQAGQNCGWRGSRNAKNVLPSSFHLIL